MSKNGSAGESSVFSRAVCTFTRRAYVTRAACIFPRFEDHNALARIKPDQDTLETMNECIKKLHHGNGLHADADELHCFVARTLSIADGCWDYPNLANWSVGKLRGWKCRFQI